MPLTQAPPVSLPTGGVARQPLVKNSAVAGDASWATDEYLDLLTGRASDFAGSIGGWVASGAGSTATYDGTVGINGNGSVKIHTTSNSGKWGSVTIAGTFVSGHHYEVVLVLKAQAESGGFITQYGVELGDNGAGDYTGSPILGFRAAADPEPSGFANMESDKFVVVRSIWTPSANRTSVWLRLARFAFDDNQTRDLWVAAARVVEILPGKLPLSTRYAFMGSSDNLPLLGMIENNAVVGFGMDNRRGGPSIRFQTGSGELRGLMDADGNWSSVYLSVTSLSLYGPQAGGIGRRVGTGNYQGVDEEYGPDYVGVVRAERSATEVEWAPDGSYDVILLDGGDDSDTTHFWQTEDATGANKSALSLLHNLKFGTVDPSAGGGVASPLPSLYLRNNGGAGELWLKTGAADTAWTRVTVP